MKLLWIFGLSLALWATAYMTVSKSQIGGVAQGGIERRNPVAAIFPGDAVAANCNALMHASCPAELKATSMTGDLK